MPPVGSGIYPRRGARRPENGQGSTPLPLYREPLDHRGGRSGGSARRIRPAAHARRGARPRVNLEGPTGRPPRARARPTSRRRPVASKRGASGPSPGPWALRARKGFPGAPAAATRGGCSPPCRPVTRSVDPIRRRRPRRTRPERGAGDRAPSVFWGPVGEPPEGPQLDVSCPVVDGGEPGPCRVQTEGGVGPPDAPSSVGHPSVERPLAHRGPVSRSPTSGEHREQPSVGRAFGLDRRRPQREAASTPAAGPRDRTTGPVRSRGSIEPIAPRVEGQAGRAGALLRLRGRAPGSPSSRKRRTSVRPAGSGHGDPPSVGLRLRVRFADLGERQDPATGPRHRACTAKRRPSGVSASSRLFLT